MLRRQRLPNTVCTEQHRGHFTLASSLLHTNGPEWLSIQIVALTRFMNRTTVTFLLALTLTLLAYSASVRVDVRDQASEVAAGQPFCVQIPGGEDYRAARSWYDTAGLLMRGSGGVHHAVLVVGNPSAPSTYHWSYLKNRFVRGTYDPFPIMCTPKRNYFSHPAEPEDPVSMRFSLMGYAFAIPRAYHPVALWPGGNVGYMILADAPAFDPGPSHCTVFTCGRVLVDVRGAETTQAAHSIITPSYRRGEQRSLHGLVYVDDASQQQYFHFSDDGTLQTAISCLPRVASCLHFFTHGTTTFSFHHDKVDLAQWRTMQSRLLALHARFISQQ